MDPRTAKRELSIWRDLSEDAFRDHLVLLEERTNAVPMEAQRFPAPSPDSSIEVDTHVLSVADEQCLADAFAFLVAIEEGAQSVAAACLEEDVRSRLLIVRFAAVDAIRSSVQRALQEVSKILSSCAEHPSQNQSKLDKLFDLITSLHLQRILGRLRSSKWSKPAFLSRSHKKPLRQDFSNLTHRVQFLYTKKEYTIRRCLEEQFELLTKLYSSFEATRSESREEITSLLGLIRSSYDTCTSDIMKDYARRLATAGQTSQVRSALKTLRQLEKIAAYYRVSSTLIHASCRYPQYFQRGNLSFVFLSPYASVPTSIGYEGWAKSCHVHAEIQIVVFYDLHASQDSQDSLPTPNRDPSVPNFLPPRLIGTSKYLCYLCYLFIKAHRRYPPANTHGRLYDQWTIPDLAEYSDVLRSRYKDIILDMDNEIVAQTLQPPLWRPEPMTSRENLLDAGQKGFSLISARTCEETYANSEAHYKPPSQETGDGSLVKPLVGLALDGVEKES